LRKIKRKENEQWEHKKEDGKKTEKNGKAGRPN
jgi:hypothetical protein